MPVLLGATGGSPRHSLSLEHSLRPLFAHLRARVVPTAVFAATQDRGSGGADGLLTNRIDQGAEDPSEMILSRPAREGASKDNPFPDLVPFTEQLTNR